MTEANRTANEMSADVLILGSGLAGLMLALKLAEAGASVIVASKGGLSDSNTSQAQGGVAAVLPDSTSDSFESHLADTVKAGAGLVDEMVARRIIKEGPSLIRQLRELGVRFAVSLSGALELAREGGHAQARVLHSKDATGRAITEALLARLNRCPNVLALKNTTAVELLFGFDRCLGALVLFQGKPTAVWAGRVVLATGGAGRVFARTTNPEVATGDGLALAYRAGARLADLEFVQFHPTALYKPGCPAFLVSEAVRGAGAVLVDARGQRFAHRFHPEGELATRDVVARAMVAVMDEQKIPCVWLDLRPIGSLALERRFPNIVERCRQYGIDPVREPVPVSPAAHYFMGGVWTDEYGRTTLPGLYAIGECASTGLHGANRLASNSLLEAGVMAMRLAGHLASAEPDTAVRTCALSSPAPLAIPSDLSEFHQMMFREAGLSRNEIGLRRLLDSLEVFSVRVLPQTRSVVEASSMLLVGQLIARSALERRESRGAHFRSDYPHVNDQAYGKRLCRQRDSLSWLPVSEPRAPVATA